ncbi:hypothetical protein R6Q59_011190 [Mikania micrantha]
MNSDPYFIEIYTDSDIKLRNEKPYLFSSRCNTPPISQKILDRRSKGGRRWFSLVVGGLCGRRWSSIGGQWRSISLQSTQDRAITPR